MRGGEIGIKGLRKRERGNYKLGIRPAFAGHADAWIGEVIAHAKAAKDAKGRQGLRPCYAQSRQARRTAKVYTSGIRCPN